MDVPQDHESPVGRASAQEMKVVTNRFTEYRSKETAGQRVDKEGLGAVQVEQDIAQLKDEQSRCLLKGRFPHAAGEKVKGVERHTG